jgi:hypothetical protein
MSDIKTPISNFWKVKARSITYYMIRNRRAHVTTIRREAAT